MRAHLIVSFALLLGACGDDDRPGTTTDGGADSAAPDSSTPPDGPMPDTSSSSDGGIARMRIRVHYDTGPGRRITVRGDAAGLTWDTGRPCTWSDGNVWVCYLDVHAGGVEFKPLIDDTIWAKGSNWIIAAPEIDIYPHFVTETGRVVTHSAVSSTILGNTRDVYVYLPPSYDENPAKRYPVLFMHDGQNLFDPALASFGVAWEVDGALDVLASTAGIVEPIVVGVASTADRMSEYTRTPDAMFGGGDADLYLRFLLEEVRPMIDATYRTAEGRVAMAGSSLGGNITLYGCWAHPETFDRCGVFSPALWWDDGDLLTYVGEDPATAADKPLRIYLDSGDSGASMDGMADTIAMRDILVAKGFVLGEDLAYVLGVGHGHDEAAWAMRAPDALAFLLDDPSRL